MTSKTEHIDEFESLFRRAEKEPFEFEPTALGTIAIVTDGDHEHAQRLQSELTRYLPPLKESTSWQLTTRSDYRTVDDLVTRIHSQQPDLVVTYRHLQESSLVPQFSLGVYLDVLTQVLEQPVLVLPGTAANPISIDSKTCRSIMVVTDHITGDSRLINTAAALTISTGELWLCHVEDDAIFTRYMDAIERIPEIETDTARNLLERQLLKEAGDFIATCIEQLQQHKPGPSYHSCVAKGHRLKEYEQLVTSHGVDLLVVNTKDEDQLAMHGMAYALCVELIDHAQLLL